MTRDAGTLLLCTVKYPVRRGCQDGIYWVRHRLERSCRAAA
jgi:hypothetical protein